MKLFVFNTVFANKITDLIKQVESFYIYSTDYKEKHQTAPFPVKVQKLFAIRRSCNKGGCENALLLGGRFSLNGEVFRLGMVNHDRRRRLFGMQLILIGHPEADPVRSQ